MRTIDKLFISSCYLIIIAMAFTVIIKEVF